MFFSFNYLLKYYINNYFNTNEIINVKILWTRKLVYWETKQNKLIFISFTNYLFLLESKFWFLINL